MRTRTIAVIIAVVVIVIAAAGATFFLTLQQPQVEGVSVSSIDNISRSGFTITFVVKLYNPNIIGITINSVNYNLVLAEGGQVLSNGTSGSFQVPARGSVEIPIQSTIFFSAAISTAFQSIFTKSVLMDLSGVVNAHLLLINVDVPFNITFDAYPYIRNSVSNIV